MPQTSGRRARARPPDGSVSVGGRPGPLRVSFEVRSRDLDGHGARPLTPPRPQPAATPSAIASRSVDRFPVDVRRRTCARGRSTWRRRHRRPDPDRHPGAFDEGAWLAETANDSSGQRRKVADRATLLVRKRGRRLGPTPHRREMGQRRQERLLLAGRHDDEAAACAGPTHLPRARRRHADDAVSRTSSRTAALNRRPDGFAYRTAA